MYTCSYLNALEQSADSSYTDSEDCVPPSISSSSDACMTNEGKKQKNMATVGESLDTWQSFASARLSICNTPFHKLSDYYWGISMYVLSVMNCSQS